MKWRAVVVAGAMLTLLGSTTAVRPALAGAIDDSLENGQAVVIGSIDRQGFELLHAYSHYIEEGPTAAEHYTVVVLADRELAPDLAQDLERLRAEGAAGKLKAFVFELNDGTGEFRTKELVGPQGFARTIPGRVRWSKEEWIDDRIIGSIFFYQGTQWGLSGPFKTIIRLGAPLDLDRSRGAFSGTGDETTLSHALVREWDDGNSPYSTILLTDRAVDWSSDPDPDNTATWLASSGANGVVLVLGNEDGELRHVSCHGPGAGSPEIPEVSWTREEWDDRVMRGRFRSSSSACGFDVYFVATVR